MIVIADPDAREGTDEEQPVMHGAERLVHEPLEEHALQSAGDDAPFVARGNLPDVEVAEQRGAGLAGVEAARRTAPDRPS